MALCVAVSPNGEPNASVAAHLAANRRVAICEMEDRPGYHTTGRSAATFLESYGGRVIRLLTTASRSFMEDPPEEFVRPLLSPMPLLWIGPEGSADELQSMRDEVVEFVPGVSLLSPAEAAAQSPIIREDWLVSAMLEPDVSLRLQLAICALSWNSVLRPGPPWRLSKPAPPISTSSPAPPKIQS